MSTAIKQQAPVKYCILQQKPRHSCPVLVPLSQCHPQVLSGRAAPAHTDDAQLGRGTAGVLPGAPSLQPLTDLSHSELGAWADHKHL